MRKVYVITIAILALGASLVEGGCEPDCSGKAPLDKVPNPRNCTEYYLCITDGVPTDHPLACEDGQEFDTTTSDCIAPTGDPCEPTCTSGADCKSTCSETPDILADTSSCNNYLICGPTGILGPFTCPADTPYFNGTGCSADESSCCSESDLCSPYCQTTSVQIPDPYDCTSYYICIGIEGMPDEKYHFKCNSGENFDIGTSTCSADAPCTTLCGGSSGGAGGLTSSMGPSSPDGHSTPTGDGSSTPTGDGSSTPTGDGSSTPTGDGISTVTPSTDCATSLTCTEVGLFARCNSCQQEYFHCETNSSTALLERCPGTLVFNTDPDYPYCILSTNCPYSP